MTKKKNSTNKPNKRTIIAGLVILILSPLGYPVGLFITELLCKSQCSLGQSGQAVVASTMASFVLLLIGLVVLINGIITYKQSKK